MRGSAEEDAQTSVTNALQVLATTASNDQMRERYHAEHSKSSCSARSRVAKSEDNRSASRSSNGSDGSGSGSPGPKSNSSASARKKAGLRKGKWTAEEEEYATRFIHYFSSGLLTLPEGKTLRALLAEKLQCDPMRITKKYAGASCLGNKISRLCDRPKFSPQDIEMARVEIARLERRFQLRLSQGVGVVLPPDAGEPVTFERNHATQPLQTISAPQAMPVATNIQLGNPGFAQTMAQTVTNLVPSAPTLAVLPPAATPIASMNNSTTAASTTPSVLSYITQLASNPQLAAALLNPNLSPMVVGAPQCVPVPAVQVPAPAPLVQQQLKPQQNTQQLPLQGLNWPMMLQNIGQAGMNAKAAQSPAAVNNDQLVQSLLLQITSQLQALNSPSPTTMRQIQVQILAATMAAPTMAATNAAVAAAPQASNPGIAAARQQFPNISAPIPAVAAAPQASIPGISVAGQQLPIETQALTQAILQATAGLQNMLPVAQATLPGLTPQGGNTNNALASLNKASNKTSSPKPPAPQTHQRPLQKRKRKSLAQKGKIPIAKPLAPKPNASVSTGNNIAQFLNRLRQGHAQAVQQTQTGQVQFNRRGSSDLASEGESTFTKLTSRSSSSATNSTSVEQGPAIKKQKRDSSDATTSSGCTTNEGSTSSIENLLASDETRNDGSTSSSMSEEDADPEQSVRRSSVPLRKRYRSETDCGITRRNLADHNVRMAEEMKNQDK